MYFSDDKDRTTITGGDMALGLFSNIYYFYLIFLYILSLLNLNNI